MEIRQVNHFIHNSARSLVYQTQSMLHVKPVGMCLITGCPRSGTSAVLFWLKEQKHVAAFYESRILISAHHCIGDVERFQSLHEDSKSLIYMVRQMVLSYYAQHKYLWHKQLIDKEPLEPIAFPDEQYTEFLQNVWTIFPKMKFLFMNRDPLAVVWSITSREWGGSLTHSISRKYTIKEAIRIWQCSAELVLEYASKPNVYICDFDRLTAEPELESRRIFEFLNIHSTNYFKPQPTAEPGFSQAERDLILDETKPQREKLLNLGATNLEPTSLETLEHFKKNIA